MNTIRAQFIEEPQKPFIVEFQHPGYFNVFWHKAEIRRVCVEASTVEGALKIAKYHYYRGDSFKVL